MGKLKYKKIENIEQYNRYCDIHEKLFTAQKEDLYEEIELLEVLIEDYDRRATSNKVKELDPIELLVSLMEDSNITQSELARELKVSKQLISDIINYRRGISKNLVKKLSDYFSMTQEAFSRDYNIPSVKQNTQSINSSIPMFELYQSERNDKYYFRLKAKNGQVILISRGYTSKSGAKNGINSVKKNSSDITNFERKVASNSKYHFNLVAKNGEIIGSSQMYSSKGAVNNGIVSVATNAPKAELKEV